MRLCLVSSIIALLVSILAESRSELILLIIGTSFFGLVGFYGCMSYRYLLCLGLSMSLTSIYCHTWLNSKLESRLAAEYSGVVVSGIANLAVCDYSRDRVEKYQLNIHSIHDSNAGDKLNLALKKLKKLSITHYESNSDRATLRCGQRIQFTAKLRSPYSFINPVGFDYEAWLLSKGIDATGYLINFKIVDQEPSFFTNFTTLRQAGIERSSNLNGFAGQVVPALLFGVSGYLEKKYWLSLQKTGAIHLFVVSGLHVSFLVLIVVFLWRRIVQLEMLLAPYDRSYLMKLTPVVLVVCCLLYAYMAGLGLAVQRSTLMIMVAIGMSYYRSHWSLLDTWLWVMLLVLVINPLACLFIGFWFSFAAVGALLMTHLGTVSVGKNESSGIILASSFQTLVRPQWIVFVALMPFLWMFQQSQSLLSLFVNILAVPLLAFCILPLSLLVLIFEEGVFTDALNSLFEVGFGLLQLMSDSSSWLVYKPIGFWLFMLLPLMLTVMLFRGFPFRRLSLLLVGLIYFLPLRAIEDKLLVLDVGQGLSLYGVSESVSNSSTVSAWIYDTGAEFRSGFSVGESVVAKNVLAFSGDRVDLLFVSHSDNDHAGGEQGLRRKINIDKTYAGQPILDNHSDCHQLPFQWYPLGDYQWRIFNIDLVGNQLSDNDLSCIVQIEYKGKRILLTGDIGREMEEQLIGRFGEELDSDILLVSHHGSHSSSSEAFIHNVSPKLALVSSGFKNSFRHPHKIVLDRFEKHEIPVYITALSGALEINIDEEISVIEWRKKNPPIWRQ